MTDVVIASSEADARAAEAMAEHHTQMTGTLAVLVDRLVSAADTDGPWSAEAHQRLETWCRRELVPHAIAEEQTLYPAGLATLDGRLLVEAMLAEHLVILDLVRSLGQRSDTSPVRAAAHAVALRAILESHVAKENDLLIPLLVRTSGVSVAGLLDGMHQKLSPGASGEHASHTDAAQDAGQDAGQPGEAAGAGCGGHTCTCGETDPAGYPELDARAIPHAIRHAAIFGALDTVGPGGGLVLAAPHDPLPLLDQVSARWPGRFTVEYVERGPDTWRLALARAGH